ncbi:hypothetical protein TNCV_1609761 [Trichonephila clavipes]|nr:hypothetical protein TNCV_1609761 [Trichonephila clavipes]
MELLLRLTRRKLPLILQHRQKSLEGWRYRASWLPADWLCLVFRGESCSNQMTIESMYGEVLPNSPNRPLFFSGTFINYLCNGESADCQGHPNTADSIERIVFRIPRHVIPIGGVKPRKLHASCENRKS